MEVHAHTHTARKKWTHYFWEFLMLFLAVFCGFLAENQREHFIEHQREKQYMRSLLEDLQTDTAMVKTVYNRALIQSSRLDSLIDLGNYGHLDQENTSKFYLLHGQTSRFLTIRFADGTSSQLKNAGGMRLIRNNQVGKAIRKYWDRIESLYNLRESLATAGENIDDLSSRIFYNKYIIYNQKVLGPIEGIKTGAVLINDDPKLVAEYINRVLTKSHRTKIYLNELKNIVQLADHLISLIKKEYHLSEGTPLEK